MSDDAEMRVKKRSGDIETVEFDKILNRIKKIGQSLNLKINYTALAMKVIDQLFDLISTSKIDELSAEQCAAMSSTHYDYNTLAGHIIISSHQKNTSECFSTVMNNLYQFRDKHNKHSPLVDQRFHQIVMENAAFFDGICNYDRDYLIDYFGFKTLERAYFMKIDGKPVERIQHMWLRVSIGIHGDNLEKVKESYDHMSQKYFTHATPTLFNAGTPRPQLSSCFLQAMEGDSIEGIYNTLKDCAMISKWAGGIGLHIHNIRASGSHIRGTNGSSNGIVPMLKVFNNTAKYVDQCVIPETIIYTTQGPKQIQHVVAGETSIINEQGTSEIIDNVLEHPYEGTIYEIETMHQLHPLSITPEHPVLCLSGVQKNMAADAIYEQIDKGIISNTWKDVKDLNMDDMLAYSIPKYEKDIDSITADDCYFYGIMLSKGVFENDDICGSITIHITNDTTKDDQIMSFCRKYFTDKCVKFDIFIDVNHTKIRWHKNIALPIRYSDIYDENKQKHITPKWLNLPTNKSQQIIKGLLMTDSQLTLESLQCDIYDDIVFDNTSIKLVESMRYILLRMGVITGAHIAESQSTHNEAVAHKLFNYIVKMPKTSEVCELNGTITHKMLNYVLRIPKTDEMRKLVNITESLNNYSYFLKHNGYLYSRIKNIETRNYCGTLYDLQMKDIHSYMSHNGVIHNGGGRRNGSFAIYLEPWHADISLFLQMRKNHGDEELKARDLFYALWIPDLFMERVKTNESWTLLCPDECPGLSDVYGDKFKTLYESYEQAGKGRVTMNARDLWFQILDAQMETGTPYLLYKDACNTKSNQKNIGTIKSSNLCTEIVEYSDENETAVCNLASIALSTFVDASGVFDYDKLHDVSKIVTENLNRVIDINYYPTEKTRRSNMRHRPIGLGVSGLADVFMKMNIPFHSDEAKTINAQIFETLYHGALEKSCELAQKEGKYETFDGSPASKGILQFDMWNTQPSTRYEWNYLKEHIQIFGLRNSLLMAPMPTASTSQILGVNECFEPITSNIYNRRTIAGEFMLTNKYLMRDLMELGQWNEQVKNNIIANNGSVQHIESVPQNIRDKYKTVWEIPMRHLIDMAADRGVYICQSQSLNLWLEEPDYNKLTSMHFYSWSKGLKTGIYYLRRRARHQAQQFTIEPEKKEIRSGSFGDDEPCEMCSA